MNSFELLPEGTEPVTDAALLKWPRGKGTTDTVVSDIGAWLGAFGPLPRQAIDLVRLSSAAYMADRLSRRGDGFSRSISLHVRVVSHADWLDVVTHVCDLLHWLTGDRWSVELSDDGQEMPEIEALAEPNISTVALLSGGLDSFCGAMLAGTEERIFVGHWDNPLVKGAQNAVGTWLSKSLGQDIPYAQIRIVQAQKKREASSRSRALLFMALGVALASARGAASLEVPENGFTSLNPPFGPERGGALSTRSTHPWTIFQFNKILEKLGLEAKVEVPFTGLTKGQLVGLARERVVEDFEKGVALTLSCAKLDGRVYKGGNPNYHCGLCYPCIVRRAAINSAGLKDETAYLSDVLTAAPLAKLLHNRRLDIQAVRRMVSDGLDDGAVIALGPFPPGYDLDAAVDLCAAGVAELGAVKLD